MRSTACIVIALRGGKVGSRNSYQMMPRGRARAAETAGRQDSRQGARRRERDGGTARCGGFSGCGLLALPASRARAESVGAPSVRAHQEEPDVADVERAPQQADGQVAHIEGQVVEEQLERHEGDVEVVHHLDEGWGCGAEGEGEGGGGWELG
eukprot:5131085-Prymnesium_polylepis.1